MSEKEKNPKNMFSKTRRCLSGGSRKLERLDGYERADLISQASKTQNS